METIVSALAGFLVWVVGNVVYLDKRRRGVTGFVRFLAFWSGLPATFFSLLLVEEGSQPALEPPPDDEEALLAEIREARKKQIGAPETGDRTGQSQEES